MKTIYITLAIVLAGTACSQQESPDAWGNFEANEITISSEANGRIEKIMFDEGDIVSNGDLIAIVDSTMLMLRLEEVEAGRRSITARLRNIDAQNRVLEQQLSNLETNIQRVSNMLADGAATQKQMDDLTGQAEVLKKQMEANEIQKGSVKSELEVIRSKKMQLLEQVKKCSLRSPVSGTILEKYVEQGELTATGRPVVKIADLSTMDLVVYVSGAMLPRVVIGEACIVRIDNGEKGLTELEGIITSISDKAEFTPKIIQTKEERVTLVYAVTVSVDNDGSLKSGMPGEVVFNINK